MKLRLDLGKIRKRAIKKLIASQTNEEGSEVECGRRGRFFHFTLICTNKRKNFLCSHFSPDWIHKNSFSCSDMKNQRGKRRKIIIFGRSQTRYQQHTKISLKIYDSANKIFFFSSEVHNEESSCVKKVRCKPKWS